MAQGALVAIALLSSAASYDQSVRSADAAEEARETELATQKNTATLQKRNLARKARVQRARIMQASESVGAGGSSGEAGGTSSVASREGAGQSFLAFSELSATAISSHNQKAADFGFRSGVASSLSSLAFQAAPVVAKF